MTQLLAASVSPRSACIRGSATMTMVPSSVDISCMPVIATIATPSTDDDSGVVARSDPEEPPTADMACQPTERGDFGVDGHAERDASRRNRQG
jgi:hypothetical protein